MNASDTKELNLEFLNLVRSKSDFITKLSKICRLLLENPCVDMNFQEEKNYNTALHLSVELQEQKMVQFLIEMKADVTVKNKEGKTAEDLAISLGRSRSLVDLLRKNARKESVKYGRKILYIDVQKRLSWDEIQKNINGSGAKAIKLLNCSTRDAALSIIEDDRFCNLINASPYVFLLVIEIDKFSDFLESNLDEFNSKIDKFRPIIVQVGSKLKNNRQHLYCREPFKKFTFCQTASEMFDCNTVEDFSLKRLLAMLPADNDGEFPQDLLQVSIDNTKSFEWGRYIDYAARYNNSLSARFLTFVAQWSLEEKNERGESVLELAAEFGDAGTISAVLDLPFKKNWSDNDLSEDHKRLLKLENEEKQTPVLIVLGKGLISAFELFDTWGLFLIDNGYEEVVDVLWELKQYDKLVKILKKDAPFPSEFNLGFNHDGIAEIVAERQSFHRAIEEKNVEEVLRFIKLHPNLKKCYNTDGKVALLTALETKSYEIFALLLTNDFAKDDNVSTLLKNLTVEGGNALKYEASFKSFPNGHIHYLMFKTRIVPATMAAPFSNIIRKLYESLNKIPSVSQVLQIMQYTDLEIVFDFRKEYISYDYFSGAPEVSASCNYEKPMINIRANQSDEKAVLGTLAHELTHLAMQIVYNNSCKPYNSMDPEKRTSFDGIVESFKNNKNCDRIQKVYDYYADDDWSIELIVLVNEMLAKKADGFKKKLENAKLLVEWYDKNVVPDFYKFLQNPWQYEVQLFNEQTQLLNNVSALSEEFELDGKMLLLSHKFHPQRIKIITTNYSKMDFLIIYQLLLGTMTKFEISRNVIFTSSDQLKSGTIHLINQLAVQSMMVIDCTKEASEDNIIPAINNLKFIDKIILLTTKEQMPQFKLGLNLKTDSVFDVGIQFNFENLTEKSKEVILDKAIIFQNASVKLRDILSRDSPIGQELLLKQLMENETFARDECPAQTPSHYVKRYFINKIIIDEDWEPETGDVLKSWDEKFYSECNAYSTKNIHFFRTRRDGSKYWVKTDGSISALKLYMNNDLFISSTDILSIGKIKKFNLLSDISGSGKTTTIVQLAKDAKNEKSNRWVSVVRLIEHTDTFYHSRNTKFDSADQAVRFVGENILKLKSPFEKELFRYSCLEEKSQVKVVLFFDCFDEVCPTYYDLVVALITQLRKTAAEQIWLATRPNLVDKLEDAFNTIHYRMQPFSEDERIFFLADYWSSVEGSKNYLKYMQCADRIISEVTPLPGSDFFGAPAFLIILAEQFRKSVQSFSDDDTFEFVGELEKGKILQLFIEKIFRIYQERKSKVPMSSAEANQQAERDRKALFEAHSIFASHLKFRDDEGLSKKADAAKGQFSDEELARIGLVSVNHDKINFIHDAFAEYFVAQKCAPQFVDNCIHSN